MRLELPSSTASSSRSCADLSSEVIVADASVTSAVDSTGLQMFLETTRDLTERGVEVWIVAPLDRPLARATRISANIGATLPPVYASLDDAVERFDDRARHDDATPLDPPPERP